MFGANYADLTRAIYILYFRVIIFSFMNFISLFYERFSGICPFLASDFISTFWTVAPINMRLYGLPKFSMFRTDYTNFLS